MHVIFLDFFDDPTFAYVVQADDFYRFYGAKITIKEFAEPVGIGESGARRTSGFSAENVDRRFEACD